MLSMLLLAAALALALVAAAVHQRAGAWRRRALRPALHLAGPAVAIAALASAPSRDLVEKLLTALLVPIGIVWLAGFGLVLWLLLRQRGRAAAAALAVWCFFSLAGNAWIGQALIARLEDGYAPPPAGATFDAVLVLGGGTELTPWGAPQLGTAGDRLRVAAALYSSRRTPLLVASGSSIAGLSDRHVRDLGRESAALWQEMGVPLAAIVQVPGPRNTSEEMVALGALVRERGWRRVGLVTSASHLRRAMRLAGGQGLAVTPIPADVRGDLQPPSAVGLVPSGGGFHAVQVATKELLAGLIGR